MDDCCQLCVTCVFLSTVSQCRPLAKEIANGLIFLLLFMVNRIRI